MDDVGNIKLATLLPSGKSKIFAMLNNTNVSNESNESNKMGIYYLKKEDYEIYYSSCVKYPLLVVEPIFRKHEEPIRRAEIDDPFGPDIELDENLQYSLDEYKTLMMYGGSMGHNAPAGQHKMSMDVYFSTFKFTNICPQEMVLNSGLWVLLENWTKNLTRLVKTGKLYNAICFTGSIPQYKQDIKKGDRSNRFNRSNRIARTNKKFMGGGKKRLSKAKSMIRSSKKRFMKRSINIGRCNKIDYLYLKGINSLGLPSAKFNIPSHMFKIIAANHIDYPDTVFLSIFLAKNQPYYIRKQKEYDLMPYMIDLDAFNKLASGIFDVKTLLSAYGLARFNDISESGRYTTEIKPLSMIHQPIFYANDLIQLSMLKSVWYGKMIYVNTLEKLESNWKYLNSKYGKLFENLDFHKEFYELSRERIKAGIKLKRHYILLTQKI